MQHTSVCVPVQHDAFLLIIISPLSANILKWLPSQDAMAGDSLDSTRTAPPALSAYNMQSEPGPANTTEPLFMPPAGPSSDPNLTQASPSFIPQNIMLQNLPSSETAAFRDSQPPPIRPPTGLAAVRQLAGRPRPHEALVPVTPRPTQHVSNHQSIPQIQYCIPEQHHALASQNTGHSAGATLQNPPIAVFAGLMGKSLQLERQVFIHSCPEVRELLYLLKTFPSPLGRILERTLQHDPSTLRIACSNEPRDSMSDSLWCSALSGFQELGLLSEAMEKRLTPARCTGTLGDLVVRLGVPVERDFYILYIYAEVCAHLDQVSESDMLFNQSALTSPPRPVPNSEVPVHAHHSRAEEHSNAPIPALIDSVLFKRNVASTLASIRYLDDHYLADGHLLHTLSLGIFKASYTHARQVLLIDNITKGLGIKLGSTTDVNLREAHTVEDGVRICRQDVLHWAGDNPRTHGNNRKRVILARVVYDELQSRSKDLDDGMLELSMDRRTKEMMLSRDLEVMFAPTVLDQAGHLTDAERRVSTLQNKTLDLWLEEYAALPRVKTAQNDLRNRAVPYVKN
jgi:hypothetical protein